VQQPEVLHVFFRHGVVPEDAIETFFEGKERVWNEERARFETSSESHILYWARHPQDDSVIVISCFRKEENDG
jgi:hypothetical protein